MTKNLLHLSYHLFVLLLSAGIALSIPHLFSALAHNLLSFWVFIENEKMFLVSLEVFTAATLIIFFNYVRQGWQARALARLATSAGLVSASPFPDLPGGIRSSRLGKFQGSAGDIMIIGSTGRRTFSDPEGELHLAVGNCRKAKIMLLNPLGAGAVARAKSIPDQKITSEVIRDQIIESIRFLKKLRTGQKNIRLKLYPDMPLLKLTILGDHAFLRHYHAGLNVRKMPEYVFSSESIHGGLYLPLYRYFHSRWHDPDIPEYDLERDELVFRDALGRETRREMPRWSASENSFPATQDFSNRIRQSTGNQEEIHLSPVSATH